MAVAFSVVQLKEDKVFHQFIMNLIGAFVLGSMFLLFGDMVWRAITKPETKFDEHRSMWEAYAGFEFIFLVGFVTILVAFYFEIKEVRKAKLKSFLFGEFFFQASAILIVALVGMIVAGFTENVFIILTWMILTRISFEILSMRRHKKAKIGINT